MSQTSWTEDRIETLTKLWRDGQSASAIARTLGGTTRNAVIGKVHRLGLSGRAVPAKPGARRPGPPKHERRVPRSRLAPVRPAPLVVVDDAPTWGLSNVVSIGPHACRWPIGEPKAPGFALCGRPAIRGAYCAPHGQIAYRPVARDHLLELAGLR